MVTFAVGWLVSTTVNVAVPPASVVTRPVVGVTVMPAVSLSMFVTADVGRVEPAVAGSVLVAGDRDDACRLVAVGDGVVLAGDRHRLRRVPVRGVNVSSAVGDRALGRCRSTRPGSSRSRSAG